MNEIEERILYLEGVILNRGIPTSSEEETIFQRIGNIRRKMEKIENDETRAFFKNFKSLTKISNEIEETKAKEYLPKDVKYQFIMSKERMVDNISKSCKELQKLKSILDVNFSKVLDEATITKIDEMDNMWVEMEKEERGLMQKVEMLVKSYRNMVNVLSRKFLYYNSVISKYEDVVDQLLAKSKKKSVANAPVIKH